MSFLQTPQAGDSQSQAEDQDGHQETTLKPQSPLATVLDVAFTLVLLELSIPRRVIFDLATAAVEEDTFKVDPNRDADDVGEADDGSVEVDHGLQGSVEFVGDQGNQHPDEDVE